MKTGLVNPLGWIALAGIFLVTPSIAAVSIGPLALVGDTGNAPDTSTGFGAVAYEYQIMQYEVTNRQYAEFLNNVATSADPYGLYTPAMGTDPRGGITRTGSLGSYSYTVRTDMGNKPVNFVSFLDAARFTNWINNGQGASTTESGVYTMTASTLIRSSTATVWIPSENEWYKAAYYNGANNSYSLYPTNANTTPTRSVARRARGRFW